MFVWLELELLMMKNKSETSTSLSGAIILWKVTGFLIERLQYSPSGYG